MIPFLASSVLKPLPRIDDLEPGCYLTDGSHLYCVVSQLVANGEIEGAALEDCATLEVQALCAEELYGLRPVRAAGR